MWFCRDWARGHARRARCVTAWRRFVDGFSKEFEDGYLDVLERIWGTRRVHANKVYNEYIKDKEHAHMNSTVWATLSIFVEYLGRTGKCVIDQTDEGYFVTFIDKDPEKERREREAVEAARADEAKEARHAAKLEAEAMARAKALDTGRMEATGLDRDADAGPVAVALRAATKRVVGRRAGAGAFGGAGPGGAGEDDAGAWGAGPDRAGKRGRWAEAEAPEAKRADCAAAGRWGVSAPTAAAARPSSAVEALFGAAARERGRAAASAAAGGAASASASAAAPAGARSAARRLERGAVVRVTNAELEGGRFLRCKGTVTRVKPGEAGGGAADAVVVKVKGSGERVVLPESDVETVVPRPGGHAIGLAGALSGRRLVVQSVDVDREVVSCTAVDAAGGSASGVPFDAVAKLDVEYYEAKVTRGGSAALAPLSLSAT